MTIDLVIRAASLTDVDEILGFLQVCMPSSPIPRTRAFWEWKHFQNPFGVSPALIAESHGKLIGLRVFMHWRWRSGAEEIAAVRAVDTATHPDWQGKGVFSDLTGRLAEQMRSEGISFVFNTPNRSSLPGYLRMGWKQVIRIPIWIRPTKPLRSLLRRLYGGRRSAGGRIGQSASACEILQQSTLEDFLSGISSDERYHSAKTKQFLKWRYADIPGFSYRAIWQCENDGGALLIFRKRIRRGFQELSISELLLSPNQNGVELGAKLLVQLAQEADADYLVATAARGTHQLNALTRAGFVSLGDSGPVFTVKTLRDQIGERNPFDWSNWHCSLGDLEIF